MERYQGKRFFSFLLCLLCLSAGANYFDPQVYPVYANVIGLMFGGYVVGQSATDWKSLK